MLKLTVTKISIKDVVWVQEFKSIQKDMKHFLAVALYSI